MRRGQIREHRAVLPQVTLNGVLVVAVRPVAVAVRV
jgi:hypothetical protein